MYKGCKLLLTGTRIGHKCKWAGRANLFCRLLYCGELHDLVSSLVAIAVYLSECVRMCECYSVLFSC